MTQSIVRAVVFSGLAGVAFAAATATPHALPVSDAALSKVNGSLECEEVETGAEFCGACRPNGGLGWYHCDESGIQSTCRRQFLEACKACTTGIGSCFGDKIVYFDDLCVVAPVPGGDCLLTYPKATAGECADPTRICPL